MKERKLPACRFREYTEYGGPACFNPMNCEPWDGIEDGEPMPCLCGKCAYSCDGECDAFGNTGGKA